MVGARRAKSDEALMGAGVERIGCASGVSGLNERWRALDSPGHLTGKCKIYKEMNCKKSPLEFLSTTPF